jgi:SWI/SNF-related matrix-associated actin-dependent regulator 1 of chromatin subfamily A
MINIFELKPPRKISGVSSFGITFSYNPAIWDFLKSYGAAAYYHKKDYTWEIPVDLLAQTLDTLTFYDEITLRLIPDNDTSKTDHFRLTDDEVLSFRFKPFEHQIEGVNFGLDPERPKWLLLDSMGLGKTNEIIMYAETLKRRGLIDHCMIICGVDSLRQNWKNEIRKFSTESCMVLGEKISKKGRISYETLKKRAEILKGPIEEFFVIVNAATLRSEDFIEAFKKSPNKFGLIAVDEAHRFATKTSAQGGNLLKLGADYKVAATGTLLINSPLSCYMPLSWTENDKATLTTFKPQYCEYGGFGDKQIIGYKNLETLREELQNCSIRRTLDQVRSDMPPKSITYEMVEMSDEHRKFYEAIREGVKEEADKIDLKSGNLLALTTRLRQATACPSILTSQKIMSSKLERAAELVEDLLSQGEKVVVFSAFKEPVYQLAEIFKDHDPLVNTGDQDESLVARNVETFQNDPFSKLFFGTHDKCGTGWTLNAASYMICLDSPWTWSSLSQSADRIWRVTNTRPAIIIVLGCAESIDDRVWEVVETKKDLADYMIDGKENQLSLDLQNEMRRILREL